MTASEYLNLRTVSSACSLTVMSFVASSVLLLAMVLVFSVLSSIPYALEVLCGCFTTVFSSVFVLAIPSMSAVNRRLVMVLPPILTVPS